MVVPDPALFDVVVDPYEVPVPYSIHQVAAWPFGLTVPEIVAEFVETPLATPTETIGPDAAAAVPAPDRTTMAVASAAAANRRARRSLRMVHSYPGRVKTRRGE